MIQPPAASAERATPLTNDAAKRIARGQSVTLFPGKLNHAESCADFFPGSSKSVSFGDRAALRVGYIDRSSQEATSPIGETLYIC